MFLNLLFARLKEVFNIKTRFIQSLKTINKNVRVSPLLFISIVSFIGAISLCFYPHNIFQAKSYQTIPTVKGISYVKPTSIPTITLTPTPTFSYKTTTQTSPTVTQTTAPAPSTSDQQTTIQTDTATPTTTPQSTQTPKSTVNLQIIDPDGTSSFSVTLNSGNNLCDNLNEAKSEGKIKSVTMTWYANFNSYYVNEINGFSNNWSITVNGVQPKVGCSLIKPNPNDTIVWKFG